MIPEVVSPLGGKWIQKALVLLLLAWTGSSWALSRDPLAVELPELSVLPGASWYWAGRQMAVNNVPMSVKIFSYPGTADEVKEFYLGLWKVAGHGKLTEKTLGDMQVLGYQLNDFQYSVQFARHGQTVDGKLVVTPTPLNYTTSKKTALPLPPRTRVNSKVESLDEGRRSETLTLDSSLRSAQILDFYTGYLEREGWTRYSMTRARNDGVVIAYQRTAELLQVNIKQLQGSNGFFSQILINWVK